MAAQPAFARESSPWLQYTHKDMEELVKQQLSVFRSDRLLLQLEDNLQDKVDQIIEEGKSEFCWSVHFAPEFMARLFFEGFLPICTNVAGSDPIWVLLPKMHRRRCVMHPSAARIGKGAAKRCKNFMFSVDRDLDAVVAGCVEQHGQSWLYPPITRAFKLLHRSGCCATAAIRSVEVWDEDGSLVAGEIGVTVGAVYTSLTGFYRVSGSGSVQLCALAAHLAATGIQMWDFGMSMTYKTELGAGTIAREEFVRRFRELRQIPAVPFLVPGVGDTGLVKARDLVKAARVPPPSGQAEPASQTFPAEARVATN
mmetsp:Transcript_848/g.1685  ORF Transcript_848/g.1685 Transcript_848/m.1685 type:complete len:311 (+) Transcript_848:55-987(+)|eukprot:CAMPEP_0204358708 /NCGR_PEP_ID=MMETSP0469-20131031/36730_1 /ASSEMBLY_ACC=CAM_ASM_000384 /TAXON_ID=2969 /ORGANISM="Oxyrrhis marina" /LENGTH=310 /DNA_ID=CAMNT_0051346627 /DNA_START=18 /DNA_END=950 /DNA_ORIENTATION=+